VSKKYEKKILTVTTGILMSLALLESGDYFYDQSDKWFPLAIAESSTEEHHVLNTFFNQSDSVSTIETGKLRVQTGEISLLGTCTVRLQIGNIAHGICSNTTRRDRRQASSKGG
jgi:hypothetical protein